MFEHQTVNNDTYPRFWLRVRQEEQAFLCANNGWIFLYRSAIQQRIVDCRTDEIGNFWSHTILFSQFRAMNVVINHSFEQ